MKIQTVDTYTAAIYVAGDIESAKRVLRQEAMRDPICVTVQPTTFIYTGGEEAGLVVGLVNYPRFPATTITILNRARQLADLLLAELAQWSALIVTPDISEWRTLRPEEN